MRTKSPVKEFVSETMGCSTSIASESQQACEAQLKTIHGVDVEKFPEDPPQWPKASERG